MKLYFDRTTFLKKQNALNDEVRIQSNLLV